MSDLDESYGQFPMRELSTNAHREWRKKCATEITWEEACDPDKLSATMSAFYGLTEASGKWPAKNAAEKEWRLCAAVMPFSVALRLMQGIYWFKGQSQNSALAREVGNS